ncbi:MAG: acyltransferase family protein [Bacteroidia bacterium]
MKQNYNLPIIDTLRGLAAMSVCLFHYICKTKDYVKDEMVLSFFDFGHYGVQMFFVISGIVIPLSMMIGNYEYGAWFRFLKKRFIRIEPPYLVSILIAIAYLSLRNYIPGVENSADLRPSLSNVLFHLGYLVPFIKGTQWINPVYWTLAIEFQYYLCLSLLFPLVLSGNWKKRSLFYLILCVSHTVLLGFGHYFIVYWFPLFLMGIIYTLWRFQKVQVLEYAIVTAICSFLVIYHIGWIDWAAGAVTLAIIYFFENFRTPITKFFGDISYSVYLVHTITGAPVINWLSHRYTEPYQKFLVISLGISIAVGCAYLMYKFVELPSKKWASSIKY